MRFIPVVADFIGTMNSMPGEVVEVLKDRNAVSVRTEFSEKMVCVTRDGAASTPGKCVV